MYPLLSLLRSLCYLCAAVSHVYLYYLCYVYLLHHFPVGLFVFGSCCFRLCFQYAYLFFPLGVFPSIRLVCKLAGYRNYAKTESSTICGPSAPQERAKSSPSSGAPPLPGQLPMDIPLFGGPHWPTICACLYLICFQICY